VKTSARSIVVASLLRLLPNELRIGEPPRLHEVRLDDPQLSESALAAVAEQRDLDPRHRRSACGEQIA
jgi:hypothetical protein